MLVEGRYRGNIDLDKAIIVRLPKKIALVTTVQFLDAIPKLKRLLEESGKIVYTDKQRQAYDTQLLGCDSTAGEKLQDKVDAYLYIGTGLFHPIWLAVNVSKDIYLYDPFTKRFELMDRNIAKRYKQKREANIKKFYAAENIGILISMKSGQINFEKGMRLKKDLEKQGKNIYIFVFETLDFNQPENFPFIDCWVNTACPRIFDDNEKFSRPLVNMDDISKLCFETKNGSHSYVSEYTFHKKRF